MFDPFFAFAIVGGPIAILYLLQEAKVNATSVPTVGTCIVALLAGYGVFDWIVMIVVLVFGQWITDAQLRIVQFIAAAVAALAVGIPFA